jgi:glycosyltransferase involved in cell wall biosynthesis
VYDHEQVLGLVLSKLKPHGLPCLMVDDGSSAACRATLEALQAQEAAWVTLLRHEVNQGKGAAIITGLRAAARLGYTHLLQIDADGQHDVADVPKFLAAARAAPTAVVTGTPIFDASVPKNRLYGRYGTHVMVWLNTLSLDIRDSMCGFRVYPVAPSLALLDRVKVGLRMDFDIEIIVRLYWAGTPVVNLPTRVVYPLDGISHFDLWRDNVRITWLHIRMLFGMLLRAPRLLLRHLQR